MTRVEEIQEAAVSFCRVEEVPNGFAVIPQLSFVVGALWADAHPVVKVGGALKNYERGYEDAIAKACEWLDCYIDNYLFIDAVNNVGIKWDNFINDFRKAMESGSSEIPNNCEKGGEE